MKPDGTSETSDWFEFTQELLTDSMLVNAYDIAHKHFPKPVDWRAFPEVVFVDSGGYETSDDHDLSATYRQQGPTRKWDDEAHRDLLDSWPARIAAIFVNYDHPRQRVSLEQQLASARRLKRRYPKQMHAFLIKPETGTQQYLEKALKKATRNPGMLKGFDVIGVTEKEVGKSTLDRMVNLARLRLALDKARVKAPIQVFGSLDPMSTLFYFLAGAEIFDGLTWLRYSYVDGRAVYIQNYGAKALDLDADTRKVRLDSLRNNVYYLRKEMKEGMRLFLQTNDYRRLGKDPELLRKAADLLDERLGTTATGGRRHGR